MAESSGAANIRAIVDAILNDSANLIANNPTIDDSYLQMLELCDRLLMKWHDYEASMKDYNELVKRNAQMKRNLKNLQKGKSVTGWSLESASAELDMIRRAQQEARENKQFVAKAEIALRDIYNIIFALQQKVNEIVHQSIDMVYVSTRGGKTAIVRLDHTVFDDLYSLDIDRNGRFVMRYNTAAIEQTIKEVHETGRANIDVLSKLTGPMQALYAEIARRYSAAEKKGSKVLLYKKGDEYYAAKFSAFGDVLEAYVDAVVNGGDDALVRSSESIFSKSFDEQIAWFVEDYVTKVDSASGFAQEDVKVGSSNLFFGVKSEGASLMGINVIVQFAELAVAAARGKATKKDINKVVNKFKGSSKTRTAITAVTEAEYNAVVEQALPECLSMLPSP